MYFHIHTKVTYLVYQCNATLLNVTIGDELEAESNWINHDCSAYDFIEYLIHSGIFGDNIKKVRSNAVEAAILKQLIIKNVR